MNNFNKLYLVMKRVKCNTGMTIFSVVLSSAALTIFCFAIMLLQVISHSTNAINNALAKDMDAYGFVNNTASAYENPRIDEYLQDINSLKEIESIGYYDLRGSDDCTTVSSEHNYWKDIIDIQNSHPKVIEDKEKVLQVVYMSRQAYGLYKMPLLDGKKPENYKENNATLLYLGNNFKDIPIGTRFVDSINHTYIVAGTFQSDVNIIDNATLFWNLGGLETNYNIPLNNLVLGLVPSEYSYMFLNNLFVCAEGYSFEQGADAIKELSKQYGISAQIGTLEERVHEKLAQIYTIQKPAMKLCFIICVSVILIILTMQLLTIFLRNNELGIWLTNGICRKDIFFILFGENMFKVFISFLIMPNLAIAILHILKIDQSSLKSFIPSLLGISCFVTFGLAVLLAIISSIIPVLIIAKTSTTNLVKGNWY